MHKLILNKNEERRILAGHQWVFSNELVEVPKHIPSGEVVSLWTNSNKQVGIGFFNPNSLISFRLLARTTSLVDENFFSKLFEERIFLANALRKKIYPEYITNTYRLCHGESDGLSGLIIDKFDNVLCIQTFSAGMELHLPIILQVLQNLFLPEAIVLRNESELRTLEGLPLYQKVSFGKVDREITINDGGITYAVDVLRGHKTGFFLDQRENRKRIRMFAKDSEVLDVFTSDGGFALNAAYGGAKSVLAIDSSHDALMRTTQNAALNDLSAVVTKQADAFDELERQVNEGKQYDMVIIDPPSLTKSKKTLSTALQAYRKLNRLGISLVKPQGVLATSSCSHHASEEDFFSMVHKASLDAKKEIMLLEKGSQAPDHPVLLAMPETQYLKFGLFWVR